MSHASTPERRGIRVGARVVIAVVALSAIAAGCLPQNGKFGPDQVVGITGTCQIANGVAPRLQALLAEAQAAGTGLQPETSSFLPPGVPTPPRIESCYRAYDMQVWWRNYYCSIGTCGMAAVPGTSKHGLGHAVDFQDAGGELTWSSPGFAWLAANAWRFGFSQPPSVQIFGPNPEPWHWEG